MRFPWLHRPIVSLSAILLFSASLPATAAEAARETAPNRRDQRQSESQSSREKATPESERPADATSAAAKEGVGRRGGEAAATSGEQPTPMLPAQFPALTVTRPPRWHGKPISLSLRDAPLVEVLRSFAKIAHVNLVVDPKVRGSVTVELHDVPWDQALYVILKSQGLAAEIDGRIWSVHR